MLLIFLIREICANTLPFDVVASKESFERILYPVKLSTCEGNRKSFFDTHGLKYSVQATSKNNPKLYIES